MLRIKMVKLTSMTFTCTAHQPMPARILDVAESVPTGFVAVHVYAPAPSAVLLSLEGPVGTVIVLRFTYWGRLTPFLDHVTDGAGSPAIIGQLMVNDWPSRRKSLLPILNERLSGPT